ncbi:hypothetical protein ACIBFB_07700 [Nocardiopsis sp. NPDC050513]|uniref:hypothetical protein n=1 Tax=Nocardiopsis sp. NPDC050513 TaxID=3364338 RepID=UPI003788263C
MTVGTLSTGRGVRPRWLPLAPLALLVTALAATGVLPTWPGLVHLVALPPLDLFGDLRVLLTTTTGPVSFTLCLAVVLAVRVTVLALMTGGLSRRRLALAAAFYGVLLPPMLLAAEFVYMAGTLLYARLFWAGLVAVAVLVLVCAPLPWGPGRRIRDVLARAWHDGFRVGVTLTYGVAVVGIGALAHLFPAATVALVPVSAAATAVAITALTRPARPGGPRRLAAVATSFAVLAWAWVATRDTASEPPGPAPPRAGSILLMSGTDSRSGAGNAFRTRTDLLGYGCDQTHYFSYAGPGNGQPRGEALCPIRTGAPYVSAHTQTPVGEQVRSFAAQTEDLPRPLVVVGHSQGAWIAWRAVATGAAPRVDALVLAGPFPESVSGYRPPGEPGPGRPASDLLHLLTPLSRAVDFAFDTESAAGYELLGTTDAPAAVFGLPLPGHTRSLSVVSTVDLPLMPSGWRLPVDRNACPVRAPHAYLPTSPAFYEEANRFLDGAPAPHCPVFRTWGVPPAVPFTAPAVHAGPRAPCPRPTRAVERRVRTRRRRTSCGGDGSRDRSAATSVRRARWASGSCWPCSAPWSCWSARSPAPCSPARRG